MGSTNFMAFTQFSISYFAGDVSEAFSFCGNIFFEAIYTMSRITFPTITQYNFKNFICKYI